MLSDEEAPPWHPMDVSREPPSSRSSPQRPSVYAQSTKLLTWLLTLSSGSQLSQKKVYIVNSYIVLPSQVQNSKLQNLSKWQRWTIPLFNCDRPRRAFELGSDDNLTAVVIGWNAEDKAWRRQLLHAMYCCMSVATQAEVEKKPRLD